MVVDRASETVSQSCILRIPSTGTHSQALAPLDIGSVCICSIGTPRESRLSHYKELLSRSDDGDGETNPVQGMVPNDDQRYIGQASVLCVLRAVKHSNHSASGPQNVRPAHRQDSGCCVKKCSWGLSAWRQSFVEKEFCQSR